MKLLNSVWVGAVHRIFQVVPKGNNCWESCPMNMASRVTHTQAALEIDVTWLPNTPRGMIKTTFTVCGHSPSAGKTCPHALLPK